MSTIWILIMLFDGDYAQMATTAEFTSQEACETARQEVVRRAEEQWWYHVTMCVKK